MTVPAITVDRVSKRFRLYHERNQTLKSALLQRKRASYEEFWALRGVGFEVPEGTTLGLIGENGSGKSTLLKCMARILRPDDGRIDIRGKVSALLELGAGFHPELSGRENVYLNASILGLSRKEVDRKVDEIIDFAGLARFIDTPVKNYSSGMYVRLGFSVAINVDPEILMVDEVLAVGDASFQKKCLGKMEDVGRQGRTVLLVSHNMHSITRLCERAVLLHQGRLIADGPAHEVVAQYLTSGLGTTAVREWNDPLRAPSGAVTQLRAVRVRSEDGQVAEAVDIRRPVLLEMEYEVLKPGYILLPHFHLFNDEGVHVFPTLDQDPSWRQRRRPAGSYVSRAHIPGNLLTEGMFYVHAAMRTLNPNKHEFIVRDAVAFQIIDTLEGN